MFTFSCCICLHKIFILIDILIQGSFPLNRYFQVRETLAFSEKASEKLQLPWYVSLWIILYSIYMSMQRFPTIDSNCSQTQTQGFSFHSERRAQPDLPTDLFSKVRFAVPEQSIFLNSYLMNPWFSYFVVLLYSSLYHPNSGLTMVLA